MAGEVVSFLHNLREGLESMLRVKRKHLGRHSHVDSDELDICVIVLVAPHFTQTGYRFDSLGECVTLLRVCIAGVLEVQPSEDILRVGVLQLAAGAARAREGSRLHHKPVCGYLVAQGVRGGVVRGILHK